MRLHVAIVCYENVARILCYYEVAELTPDNKETQKNVCHHIKMLAIRYGTSLVSSISFSLRRIK